MPDIIEQVQMIDIRKAIRKAYPNRNPDWLAYQWQRAIDNTDINADQVYLPALVDHDMPCDKAIALEILEHAFGIDLDGNPIDEDYIHMKKESCDNCGTTLNKSEQLNHMDNDGKTITLCANC